VTAVRTRPELDPADAMTPADEAPPRRRAMRSWLAIGAVLLVLVVLLLVMVAHSRGNRGTLDPRATDPTGSRALAALLSDRSVSVDRGTDPGDALDAMTGRTVLLLAFPNSQTDETLRRVAELGSGSVLLVNATQPTVDKVADGITVSNAEEAYRDPDCDLPAATAAGGVEAGGRAYRVADGVSCYSASAGGTPDGGIVAVTRTRGGATLLLVGDPALLTNDRLARDGNAALALNLLGADGSADRVRWVVRSPGSAAADDRGARGILPDWVGLAALQLLFAGLVTVLWRSRRLGPPVLEPLPVVVRAAETVEGRARLYRRAQARDRAAEALRSGARARLVPRLGLGREAGGDPDPHAVVDAVAELTGRPDAQVDAVLYGPPPTEDNALVALADELDSIVRDALDPEVHRP
jgi:Domain of unknown function (DUF4350)